MSTPAQVMVSHQVWRAAQSSTPVGGTSAYLHTLPEDGGRRIFSFIHHFLPDQDFLPQKMLLSLCVLDEPPEVSAYPHRIECHTLEELLWPKDITIWDK